MSKKDRKRDEFSVGLTVLIAVVVLIGGIIWGKGISFDAQHKVYYVQFSEVFGLKEGSAVLVQGVAHGKVGEIHLNEIGALVEINLDENIILYKDATVMLFAPQLMGGKMVTIDPGNGPAEFEQGGTLRGYIPAGVGEVVAGTGEVLDDVQSMVRQLKATAVRLDSAMIVSQMIPRIDSTLANLNAMTMNLRDNLDVASYQLRQGAETLNKTTREFDGMVSENRPRMDSLLVRLNTVADDAQQLSHNLSGFSRALNDQEGTIGKLAYSDTLHNQLVRTLANFDSLAKKLKKDGVTVKLF